MMHASDTAPDEATGGRRGRLEIHDLQVFVLTGGGLVLALAGAARVRLVDMTDLGLASVLPVVYWAALVMIACAFALAFTRQPIRELTLALPTAAMGLALFGVVAIASTVPRDHVGLRHVGIVQNLLETGRIDGMIDAYFSWPAFFALAAFVSEVFGNPDLAPIIRWAPLVARLALLAPILMLARALLPDRRSAWAVVWIAMLWDWVDQDYFAPQTFALFLYLVILALVVQWLVVKRSGASPPPRGRGQRAGIYLVVLLLATAMIPAHQLTPVVTGLALIALALSRRLPQFGLPIIVVAGIALWIVTGADAYQSGHDLLNFPDLTAVFNANVGSRVSGGSELHSFVVLERMVMSASLWALAFLGFIRARRAGKPVLLPALLAAAPFTMLPLQAYGGEMLMRIHLFALPAMAVLAVRFLAPPQAPRKLSAAVILVISLLALPGLIIARYGTDRLEVHTQEEVHAVEALYDAVPAGGLLVAASPYTPWRHHDYDNYKYRTLVDLVDIVEEPSDPRSVVRTLVALLDEQGSGGIIFTRTAYEGVEMLGTAIPLQLVEEAISRNDRFNRTFWSTDGTVYTYEGARDDAG